MSGKLVKRLRSNSLTDVRAVMSASRIGVRNRYEYVRNLVNEMYIGLLC